MNAKKMKKVRKIVAKEFHKDVNHLMELKFLSRVKLALCIVFKIK